MRRISQVEDLELSNHKSWFQPLYDEENTPFVLVSVMKTSVLLKYSNLDIPEYMPNVPKVPMFLKILI